MHLLDLGGQLEDLISDRGIILDSADALDDQCAATATVPEEERELWVRRKRTVQAALGAAQPGTQLRRTEYLEAATKRELWRPVLAGICRDDWCAVDERAVDHAAHDERDLLLRLRPWACRVILADRDDLVLVIERERQSGLRRACTERGKLGVDRDNVTVDAWIAPSTELVYGSARPDTGDVRENRVLALDFSVAYRRNDVWREIRLSPI